MDWYPLLNSLRIAAISAAVVFFTGIAAAYYIAKLPRLVKGILDVILTLPLALPPTVVGYLLLRVLGPKRLIGAWVLDVFGIRLVMTWWSAIFATVVVVFPLMYRTVRGAFEAFDETLAYAGQTLGLSNTYIFWHIRMPYCRQGVLAGAVLAFARALGEYGATSMIAGYTPGKTATVSTTVYQLWQVGNDTLALKWVLVNIGISAVILLVVNMLEKKNLLSDFDGPILWVSHDLGECCRNCRTVCVMENGVSGAVTDMESLVRRPPPPKVRPGSPAAATFCPPGAVRAACAWTAGTSPCLYPPEMAHAPWPFRTAQFPRGPVPTGRKYSEPSSI